MNSDKKNTNENNNSNNNKAARASAATQGVSFIFAKSGKPCILRAFRQQHDVSVFSFSNVLRSCFLVAFLRKCRKYHAFRAFLSSILASFSKFLSGKLQKREVFAWSTCGKPSNKYPEMTTKTIRRRSTKQKENTSRIRMDVITPPPPHPSPPLHRTTT